MDYSWEEKVFMFIALFLNPLLLHLIGNIATKDDEHQLVQKKETKKKKERQLITRQWITFFHQCPGISRQGLEEHVV